MEMKPEESQEKQPSQEKQSQENSQKTLKETSTVYKILGRSIPSTKFENIFNF
jgi:hypothetical protein